MAKREIVSSIESNPQEENGRVITRNNEELHGASKEMLRYESKMKTPYVLAGLVVILIVIVFLSVAGRNSSLSATMLTAFSEGKWQAVFLNNNQVYFGHLKQMENGYLVLTNVFYLQAVQPLQQGAQVPPPQLQLVKLGNELHGPTDQMYIPQSNLLFWETMKDDSQVVKAITDYIPKSE